MELVKEEQVLYDIIENLIQSEHLKRSKPFIKVILSFKRKNALKFEKKFIEEMPLTKYEDYKPLLYKIIAENGPNIMALDTPFYMFKENDKMYPFYRGNAIGFISMLNAYIVDGMNQLNHSNFSLESKILDLITLHPIQHENSLKIGLDLLEPFKNDIEPYSAKYIKNFKDRQLISFLFAFNCKDLTFIRTTIELDFTFIKRKWTLLLNCIKKGVMIQDRDLDEKLDPQIRTDLESKFEVIEGRYEELNNIKDFELNQIWPNLALIMTNSRLINPPKTQLINLPYSHPITGIIGLPIFNHPNHFELKRSLMYYEFKNLNSNQLEKKLKMNDYYELIVTNLNGWVRVQTQQVFRFKGCRNGNPILQFIGHKDVFDLDYLIYKEINQLMNNLKEFEIKNYVFYKSDDHGIFLELEDEKYTNLNASIQSINNDKVKVTLALKKKKLKTLEQKLNLGLKQIKWIDFEGHLKVMILPPHSMDFIKKELNKGKWKEIPLFIEDSELVDKLLELSKFCSMEKRFGLF